MKKKILFTIIFVVYNLLTINSEDILFVSKTNSIIYEEMTLSHQLIHISKGEKIISLNISYNNSMKVKYKDKIGWVSFDDIIPYNSDTIDDLIYNNDEFQWVMSYYIDILKSNKRNTVYKYEPAWKNRKGYMGSTDWWNNYNYLFFKFSNANIYARFTIDPEEDNASLLIKNIKKNDKSYTINVKKENSISSYILKWDRVKNKEEFNLVLKIDGDYMDIYLEDEKTKLCELIKVDEYFIDALREVVREDNTDLSLVEWPKRASQTSIQNKITTEKTDANKITTYKTTASLRIRESSDTNAKIITTLPQGSKVEVFEKGKADTINGIKGNWVKVKTEKGETGWCFDGYLEIIK